MNLIHLANKVEERYKRYLETTFYFRDPQLRNFFQDALNRGHLRKGPYLEATPLFKRRKKTKELFRQLVVEQPDEGFLNAMLGERLLYLHQEEAIKKIFGEGKNVVVMLQFEMIFAMLVVNGLMLQL